VAVTTLFDFLVPYRQPKKGLRYLWLRSAVIVFVVILMRLLQQQSETKDLEVFQPLVMRTAPTLPCSPALPPPCSTKL